MALDYLTVLMMLAKAAPGILSSMKRAKARREAEAYLKEKYGLTSKEVNVGFTMRSMEMVYPDEWEKTLFRLLQNVLSARELSLELSEVCADIYIMVSLLSYGEPRKLNEYGEYKLAYESYPYVKSLHDTKTHESLQDLARGRGNVIALPLVQKETQAVVRKGRARPIRAVLARTHFRVDRCGARRDRVRLSPHPC